MIPAIDPPSAAIDIRMGLPEKFRGRAAELCYKSQRSKWKPIFGSWLLGVEILEYLLNPQHTLVAMREGELAGFSGISLPRRPFLHARLTVFTQQYGWFRGTGRWLAFKMLSSANRKNELKLEGLAVASSMKGLGVGESLLEALSDWATCNGMDKLRIDLAGGDKADIAGYLKCGFKPIRVSRYGLIGKLLRMPAVTTMVKDLRAA